mgnify:CR=1 FL=1
MNILFIVQDLNFIEPIGMLLISALAKSKGYHTHLGILSREDIFEKIRKIQPDIIAYSATTGEHKYYVSINEKIKSNFKNIMTIMGGPHSTFCPESISNKNYTFDAFFIGEGDIAFPQFLDVFQKKGDVSSIKNVITRSSRSSELHELVSDLDSLPFPDRDLLYGNTEMGESPIKSFLTSRGCPYHCTYCFNRPFNLMYRGKGKILRRHSVDYVIEEIQRVRHKYPMEVIKFYDDVFAYKADGWIEEFSRRYRAEIGIPFHCLTRANLVTGDILKLLKEAGCVSMVIAIEAGNFEVRKQLLNRDMSNEVIINAFELCKKYGINTYSNNMVGLPNTTIQHDIEPLDLNLKAKVMFGEFFTFHPYPGTELGDYCKKNNICDIHYDDFGMYYTSGSPLSCFTKKEKNIQKNITNLGTVVLMFPFLRNIVINYLIYLPYNKIYFLMYYAVKAYLIKTRIYPFKFKLRRAWKWINKSYHLIIKSQSNESYLQRK